MMMKLKSFPELHTERLLLREILPSDADIILFLRSNETVTKYIYRPENRKTKNLTDAGKFIEEIREQFNSNRSVSWGISLKDDLRLIGSICLWNFSVDRKTAEVGYDLDPHFHKKGIMNEALKVVIDYAFQNLKFENIEAFTHRENIASKDLLTRNGFQLSKERTDPDNSSNLIYELKVRRFSA